MINPNITFIIGGSYGLDKAIKNRSNYKLSFSKLTFHINYLESFF